MSEPSHANAEIARIADALGDPTRRRAYFTLREAREPLTRAEVAQRIGIDPRLAGFHLDKLVTSGFLEVTTRRREHGAGRPPKVYAPVAAGLSVSLPERHYDLLASLLLEATRDTSGDPPQQVLERVGHAFGRRLGLELAAEGGDPARAAGDAARALAEVLAPFGFEPVTEGGRITACSCPFEDLAFADAERICGLDRAIWRGALSAFSPASAVGRSTSRASGDPECSVELVEAGAAS
jgi:predicted ArsR family transcriptional regulator